MDELEPTMSVGGPRPLRPDHYHGARTGVHGSVNTFGQIKVQFHSSPTRLAHWFDNTDKDPVYSQEPPRIRRTKTHLPPPRLNIAIHICGSRGDVQPFIPIAKLLQAPPHGHRIRICTHEQFKDFVESNGLEFFSIGNNPEELMAYMVKNPGLLPGMESIRAGDIAKRRKGMAEMFEGTWRSCIEAGNGLGPKVTAINVDDPNDLFIADMIIANPPSMGHIHCAEKLGIPLHIVFTMPWSPTKTFHHPLAAMQYDDQDESVANYFSFVMMELLTWQGLGDLINKFRTHTLKLDPISPMWGFQLLHRLRVPHSYLWSQALIPKPSDWAPHLNVTGFSFLKMASSYIPPDDLAAFLKAGPPPVYIGFGSIVVKDSAALTQLIFDAVKLAGVRAVVSKGWGGMGAENVPDDVYLVGNCPHDWLFQHVSCVVHHGGAGTTAIGIALGKPTVVVPFFGDQPFWGQMVAAAGAGPKPVPFKHMTAQSLSESIKFALRDEVGVAVKEMATQIAEEDVAGDTVHDIEHALGINSMRCGVMPERLAVWVDKHTGIHLSGLAVCVLASKRLLHPSRLKLLKHRDWYVHEGAEGPMIGAVAAVSVTASAIATNTHDFSARLKKPQPPTASDNSLSESSKDPVTGEVKVGQLLPTQMEAMAWRMAGKTFDPDHLKNFNVPGSYQRMSKARERIATDRAKGGRPRQVGSALAHYAFDLSVTGAKFPVAYFYQVANGYRNMPSYIITNEKHRQRDEIKGLGTGLKVAGKECVINLGEAFGGVVRHPYVGAKTEGPRGFGKGIGRGLFGLYAHLMAALHAIPGYSLKGVEQALSKLRLKPLHAEILLIRLRQANYEYNEATEKERDKVIENWKKLERCVGKALD